jgi:hypothetical protein
MNISLIKNLLSSMSTTLEKIAQTSDNSLQRAEQSYLAAQEHIYKLKEYIVGYIFKDEQEEIRFFKEIKPLFLKELIYYTELFYIETNKPVGSIEVIKEYYALYLNRVRIFFERNQVLYQYHRTGKTNYDGDYYRRDATAEPVMPHFMPEMDNRFSTLYSFKLSKIMAYELLRDYLQNSILEAGQPQLPGVFPDKKRKRMWTATKSALIEMAYALHASGAVNHGQGNIKDLIQDLEVFFDIQVGNFYRTIQSMRIRKKERTIYLHVLIENLERWMDDTDMDFMQ